ncbi:MAG: HAD family phosphatase [Eubacterium sp.]|nr:HAD family phosphatase [Eubacterium sp.]MDD7209069.1 HAD family phosphatase [Lachnospiraceae bacterium]MDY5496417.1 HAD family phosphatase [Anaerobutyricum sp.]
MKKGVIFDMDGLLFDTERLYRESWKNTAIAFGRVPDPMFPQAVCGTSGEMMLELIRQYYPGVDAIEFKAACVDPIEHYLKTSTPEKPGIHEMISYLKENGVKIAIASSSNKNTIIQNLKNTKLINYFDIVVSGEDVHFGKPNPEIFLLAAEKMGLDPKECYVFEDGFNGIRAGAAAGCATVMIPDLNPPTKEIEELCGGRIFDSLLIALDAMKEGRL